MKHRPADRVRPGHLAGVQETGTSPRPGADRGIRPGHGQCRQRSGHPDRHRTAGRRRAGGHGHGRHHLVDRRTDVRRGDGRGAGHRGDDRARRPGVQHGARRTAGGRRRRDHQGRPGGDPRVHQRRLRDHHHGGGDGQPGLALRRGPARAHPPLRAEPAPVPGCRSAGLPCRAHRDEWSGTADHGVPTRLPDRGRPGSRRRPSTEGAGHVVGGWSVTV